MRRIAAGIFVMLISMIAFAAPTLQQPLPAIPNLPVQPLQPSPALTQALAKPVISGFSPISCVNHGGALTVVGKNFGATQGARAIALGGHGVHVDVTVESWSDTRIRVRIPNSNKLQAGQWYYAGIERSDHGQWLSNIDRNIEICANSSAVPSVTLPAPTTIPIAPVTTLTPQPPPPDTGSAPTAPVPQPPVSTLPADPGAYSEPSSQSAPRRSSGSLVGQALPPPSVQDYTPRKTRDTQSEPDELMVVSADMPQALQVQQFGQGLGFGIKRRSVLQGLGLVITVFRLPQGQTPEQALQLLRGQAPELWADLNHRYTLQGDNEARHYAQKMLAWPANARDCGRGVRIGVVDGPLPSGHPALRGARITSQSFVTRGVPTPAPEHALAIGAILVGHERGLVPAAELFHAQVMRQRDRKQVDSTADWLVQGLNWLAQQQVEVINLSLGGPRNLILEAAIQRLVSLGIPVVAAAGNQGPEAAPVYPAALKGVIAVTAVDAERRLYRQANRGDYIAFAAPGVDVWVPRSDGEVYVSGTSFAAPHVTAALVVRRQMQPQADWSAHVTALISAAQDLGDAGRDPLFGWGLVQLRTNCGA